MPATGADPPTPGALPPRVRLRGAEPEKINFIKNVRDVCLHFKPRRAEAHLLNARAALEFDRDRSAEHKLREHGVQKMLREATRAYVLHRA